MKDPSVVGRNWCRDRVFVVDIRVFAGTERRREIFSLAGRERGMFKAVRSSLNWVWVSVGCFGCTAGLLDQMQTCRTNALEAGWRRS
jgi:hypothetical protein